MKARETDETFGERLAEARPRRGHTQAELGKAVGVSQRVIAYYEAESDQPPGALLADLAQALKVSADELLGLKPLSEKTPIKTAQLRKRLQKRAPRKSNLHCSRGGEAYAGGSRYSGTLSRQPACNQMRKGTLSSSTTDDTDVNHSHGTNGCPSGE